jgi:hypothetical protein
MIILYYLVGALALLIALLFQFNRAHLLLKATSHHQKSKRYHDFPAAAGFREHLE